MPSFKSNLDLNQNQLLNAVLQNQLDLPQNPVAGQLYYNPGKQTAYLWNGEYWIPWGQSSGGQGQDVKQYMLNIINPSINSASVFVRLFEDQEVVRIDSHFSAEPGVDFSIEARHHVNERGIPVTNDPIGATYEGTETTIFSTSQLRADDWLYFEIVQKDVGGLDPKEGDPGITPGAEEPPAGGIEGEVLGVLTITITCVSS
jgi:hypothetical protein